MRFIIGVLFLVLAGLQYKLWLGDGNLFQWYHLEKKHMAQLSVNDQLMKRNNALEAEIVELQSDEQAIEEQARFELGMVKDGEVYYRFVE